MTTDEIKLELRELGGLFIRMTEWHDGFQCCAFSKKVPHKIGVVSKWLPTEDEAWRALYAELKEKGIIA